MSLFNSIDFHLKSAGLMLVLGCSLATLIFAPTYAASVNSNRMGEQPSIAPEPVVQEKQKKIDRLERQNESLRTRSLRQQEQMSVQGTQKTKLPPQQTLQQSQQQNQQQSLKQQMQMQSVQQGAQVKQTQQPSLQQQMQMQSSQGQRMMGPNEMRSH